MKEAKQGSVYMNGNTGLGSEDIKMHEIILYLEPGSGFGKWQGCNLMKPVLAFSLGFIRVVHGELVRAWTDTEGLMVSKDIVD